MSRHDSRAPGPVRHHRYGAEGLWGEAVRAGLGLTLGLGLMLVAGGGLALLAGILLTSLFATFGATVLIRRRTVISSDDAGIAVATGLPAAIPFGYGSVRIRWDEVTGLSLRYFSTRRDRSDGWMQLTIRGHRGTAIALSTISDFRLLTDRAAKSAADLNLNLGQATRRNLEALGSVQPE